ncbi:MAG: DUF4923 family protein [Alistipes sp.]|nr:DUF4923 family protein [Alistipes sp.]
MRRFMMTIAVAFATMAIAPVEVSAQFDLGKALGQLLGGSATTPADDVPTPYDRLRENAPAKSKLMGTWQYKGATIEYLGDNPLADAALKSVEGYGIAELKKLGVIEGCCSLTLRRNGLAVVATRDALQEGTYTYDESDASVVIKGTYDGTSYRADGYVKIVGGRLIVMVDAMDVLKEILKASPELATDQTVITTKALLESFGDVYISVMWVR